MDNYIDYKEKKHLLMCNYENCTVLLGSCLK